MGSKLLWWLISRNLPMQTKLLGTQLTLPSSPSGGSSPIDTPCEQNDPNRYAPKTTWNRCFGLSHPLRGPRAMLPKPSAGCVSEYVFRKTWIHPIARHAFFAYRLNDTHQVNQFITVWACPDPTIYGNHSVIFGLHARGSGGKKSHNDAGKWSTFSFWARARSLSIPWSMNEFTQRGEEEEGARVDIRIIEILLAMRTKKSIDSFTSLVDTR